MKVLIIPEDFRKDQFILKPILDRLFQALNQPNARVQVCQAPLLQGVSEALKHDRIQEIIERYPMVDQFILCVDRDGVAGRQAQLSRLEDAFSASVRFLAVNAWEELETWVLAGLDLPSAWRWSAIRAEISVKERYFEPLAKQKRVADGPGGGRKALAEQASRKIAAIRQKCAEDFDNLANRLTAYGQP
jgi:hypothetical protein